MTPHPERDPAGHSYRRQRPFQPLLTEENGSSHQGYLYGIDLFNAGFYWEAHVEWEELWQASSDESTRLFLQALVQIAAAMVKLREGSFSGVDKLAFRAGQKLASLSEESPQRFGLRLAELEATSTRLRGLARARAGADERPTLVFHS